MPTHASLKSFQNLLSSSTCLSKTAIRYFQNDSLCLFSYLPRHSPCSPTRKTCTSLGSIVSCFSPVKQRNRYPSLINRYSSLINRYSSLINRYPSLINRYSSLINRYSSHINRYSSLINRYSSLINRQSSIHSFAFVIEIVYRTNSASDRLAKQIFVNQIHEPTDKAK